MLNIEKYKDKILKRHRKHLESFSETVERIVEEEDPETYREKFVDRMMTTEAVVEWLASEYVAPLLNKKEMEYLSGVVNPFLEHVEYIRKRKVESGFEYISIVLGGVEAPFNLPVFKEGEMYTGMELDKKYTVEELGLCHVS